MGRIWHIFNFYLKKNKTKQNCVLVFNFEKSGHPSLVNNCNLSPFWMWCHKQGLFGWVDSFLFAAPQAPSVWIGKRWCTATFRSLKRSSTRSKFRPLKQVFIQDLSVHYSIFPSSPSQFLSQKNIPTARCCCHFASLWRCHWPGDEWSLVSFYQTSLIGGLWQRWLYFWKVLLSTSSSLSPTWRWLFSLIAQFRWPAISRTTMWGEKKCKAVNTSWMHCKLYTHFNVLNCGKQMLVCWNYTQESGTKFYRYLPVSMYNLNNLAQLKKKQNASPCIISLSLRCENSLKKSAQQLKYEWQRAEIKHAAANIKLSSKTAGT